VLLICCFVVVGSDVGLTVVTVAQGIWRDIGLVFAHNVPVLMDVGVTPSLTKGAGPNGTVADNQQDVWSVVALLRFQMPAPAFSFINVTLTLNTPTPVVHSVVTTANSTGFAEVTIPNISGVDVWWPNGYGRQPLYTLNATVHAWSVPGVNLTSQSKQVSMGFRTIELVQDPLPGGKSFEFHVNDVRGHGVVCCVLCRVCCVLCVVCCAVCVVCRGCVGGLWGMMRDAVLRCLLFVA